MCGMTGLLLNTNEEVHAAQLVDKMATTLASRGPDAFGVMVDHPVAFGHARLSIIDLSDAGSQPMRLGERGPMLTYNGEVYNFKELRQRLERLGHLDWRGYSDTEVILHTYAQWGIDGLKQLEGMFALALWDPQLQRLILMRDRLGIKPLYYAQSKHGLAFGSEIKAVLAAGGVDTSMDEQTFSEYLWYGNSHGANTIYQGVKALEPGHMMVVENGKATTRPWWRIEEWVQKTPVKDFKEACTLLRMTVDEAVARQLVADVPLGLFLSGGVDSTVIAGAAMQNCPDPLISFTAGFDYAEGTNELGKAASVAAHFGLAHNEMHISGANLEGVLGTLVRAHDEPFADAANIPLYLMCRRLPSHVKVVLQGDGGDELFAGYRRYVLLSRHHWWRNLPKGAPEAAQHLGALGRRFSRIAHAMRQSDPALRMAYLMTVETAQSAPDQVLTRDYRQHLERETDPFMPYRLAAARFKDHDPVQQMLLTDLTVQLPSQFLPKVDRATMAAGIEARVPLLDDQVLRLALTFPSSWKIRNGERKAVLRASQAGRIPSSILNAPKDGFDTPYEYWLKTTLHGFAKQRLLDGGFLKRYGLDAKILEQMLKRHKDGSAGRGFMIWKLLQLALWDERRDNTAPP